MTAVLDSFDIEFLNRRSRSSSNRMEPFSATGRWPNRLTAIRSAATPATGPATVDASKAALGLAMVLHALIRQFLGEPPVFRAPLLRRKEAKGT